jgi:hypothetical protein
VLVVDCRHEPTARVALLGRLLADLPSITRWVWLRRLLALLVLAAASYLSDFLMPTVTHPVPRVQAAMQIEVADRFARITFPVFLAAAVLFFPGGFFLPDRYRRTGVFTKVVSGFGITRYMLLLVIVSQYVLRAGVVGAMIAGMTPEVLNRYVRFRVVRNTTPSATALEPPASPKGVRGWLLVFLIHQAVLWAGAVYAFAGLYGRGAVMPPGALSSWVGGLTLLTFIWLLLWLVGTPAGLVLVGLHSPRTVRYWIVYLFALAGMALLWAAGLYVLSGAWSATAEVTEPANDPILGVVESVAFAIGCLCWIGYLALSRRVDVTFRRKDVMKANALGLDLQ